MITSTTSDNTPTPSFVARFDRGIVNIAGQSVRHLVIAVTAPAVRPSEGPRLPLNLGLVLDASGSMSGTRLEAAKQATLTLLDKLPATDHLSLVSFASDVILHADAVRLDEAGKRSIAGSVRYLTTRGSTNLFEGWIGGCTAVAKRQAAADSPERNHVIVLSDGHANRGEVHPVRLAHHSGELRQRGVLTSTVGVGEAYSPVQLQAISEAGGGRMHDAELPDEIAEIMLAEVNDALATTVENLEFRLHLPAGVKAEVYGTFPINTDAEGCEILAGSMLGGSTRQLVVKLVFPAGNPGDTLKVGVSAGWTVPGEAKVHRLDIGSATVCFDGAAACLAQSRCRELAGIVVEKWLAHIIHRSMLLNEDGQFAAAREFVEVQSRYLTAYCEGLPELAAQVAEAADLGLAVSGRMDRISAKEMLLRSYKTGRGEMDHRSRRRKTAREILAEEAARRRGEP